MFPAGILLFSFDNQTQSMNMNLWQENMLFGLKYETMQICVDIQTEYLNTTNLTRRYSNFVLFRIIFLISKHTYQFKFMITIWKPYPSNFFSTIEAQLRWNKYQ
jgi:hypothetical protein